MNERKNDAGLPPGGQGIRPSLRASLDSIAEKCIACKLCRKECNFLQKYGNPKELAESWDPGNGDLLNMAFECSLCGLCGAVCPVGIDPAAMFLEMRRESVERGYGEFSGHKVITGYERRGTSKRYTWYAIPEECDTVLFPGCTLPGTRPDKVKSLFLYLQKEIPGLGVVLDCCCKPSHDLGREGHFQAMFTEMRDYLLKNGVKNILVACPNCHRVFNQYGTGLKVMTFYEFVAEKGLRLSSVMGEKITVHDPCGTRHQEQVQESVRRIAGRHNLRVEEMEHSQKKTLCCGEGGSVGFIRPEFAEAWSRRRLQEAGGRKILTYCAGCANFLGSGTPTIHILDLIFEPEAAMAGRVRVSRAPFTYWNRIRLKKWFKKNIPASISRERDFPNKK